MKLLPSLSWEGTRAIAIIIAVALLVAGALLATYGERSFRQQEVSETEVQARILANLVEAALDFQDRDAAFEYVNALDGNPAVQSAAIYDAGGKLFADYARKLSNPAPRSAEPTGSHATDAGVAVIIPVTRNGAQLGSVYIERTTEPVSRRLEREGLIALFLTMTSLVVAVLGIAHGALRRANAELETRAGDLTRAYAELQAQTAEREKAEAALRQSQKMEAIGQLTGGVAHDFNNLLQVIIGNLDMMRRRIQRSAVPEVEELKPRVEAATHAGERAAALTQRLLAFSRRQPLAPKPIDVNRLVAGMSDLLHRSLGEAIRIETVLAGGLWPIFADANQLESALLNLAVNARDAMPEGGKLTIETANAYLDDAYALAHEELTPGQYVVIQVSDTGTGMTEDIRLKAFDPFFTTKDVGKGTGLGLSQVYGFIKQSGGHAQIYSEVGQGTTVKLYLSRLTDAVAQAELVDQVPQIAPAGGGQLILVVEDQQEVRDFSVLTLRQLGYTVIEAPDGHAGLRMLDANPAVRLLFTDIGLPGGLNGRQLADEAMRRCPGLKVLYTTGYARNAIVHNGRLDPGVALIGKPFSYGALASKVRELLEEE